MLSLVQQIRIIGERRMIGKDLDRDCGIHQGLFETHQQVDVNATVTANEGMSEIESVTVAKIATVNATPLAGRTLLLVTDG